MRWGTYFAVLASVLSVGLALGVSMPLVSLRLEAWGYGSFAIGVMAAILGVGRTGRRQPGQPPGRLGWRTFGDAPVPVGRGAVDWPARAAA